MVGRTIREYLLTAKVGEGGVGAVFKAQHTILNEPRAVKVLKETRQGDPAFMERFVREAKLLSGLRHPNIALLHDFFEHTDGNFYMVMEWAGHYSLRNLIQDRHSRGEGFREEEVLRIAKQVCAGLTEPHQKGIIHRDLSPENVMVVRSGEIEVVKLVDFGIAKRTSSDDGGCLHSTQPGVFIGKFKYCSPEQADPEFGKALDHRSDLYSLGVVLYEMVSGELPFEAKTPLSYLKKQVLDTPRPLGKQHPVSPPLRELIGRLLEKDRTRRPSSSLRVAMEIGKIQARHGFSDDRQKTEVDTEGPTRIVPNPQLSAPRGLRTRFRPSLIFGCVLLALLAGAGLFYWLDTSATNVGSIELRSDPAGAQVFLDGRPVSSTPGRLDALRPGRWHTISIVKAGYEGWQERLNLKKGENLLRDVRLIPKASSETPPVPPPDATKLPGTEATPTDNLPAGPVQAPSQGILAIASAPSGADVYLNGRLVGKTPVESGEFLPGEPNTISVTKEGYREWTRTIRPVGDERMHIQAPLRLLEVPFRVYSSPPGATVVLGDRRLDGLTPLKIASLQQGRAYTLRLEMAGYQPWHGSVIPTATGENELRAELKKAEEFGSLKIISEPWTRVILDGEERGDTPVRLDGLRAGKHQLVLYNDSFNLRTEPFQVVIKPNQTSVEIREFKGILRIKSVEPLTAFVDDQPMGQVSEVTWELLAGPHTLRLLDPAARKEKHLKLNILHNQTLELIEPLAPGQR